MKMYLSGCNWGIFNAWSVWKNFLLFCCFDKGTHPENLQGLCSYIKLAFLLTVNVFGSGLEKKKKDYYFLIYCYCYELECRDLMVHPTSGSDQEDQKVLLIHIENSHLW